jgi:hypothetical protein
MTATSMDIPSFEKKPRLFIIRDPQDPADIISFKTVWATDILHET